MQPTRKLCNKQRRLQRHVITGLLLSATLLSPSLLWAEFEAVLSSTYSVSLEDGNGNRYIADKGISHVRKIDNSIITITADNDQNTSNGDDDQVANSELKTPSNTTFDSEGNFYIAEITNHRIRKVDTKGNITTFAGTGEAGFSGDEGPASEAQVHSPNKITFDNDGNLYISDQGNNRIRKVDIAGIITTAEGDNLNNLKSQNIRARKHRYAFFDEVNQVD